MKQRDLILIVGFSVGLSTMGLSYAQEAPTSAVDQREIQKLELTAGKSRVLDLPVAIKRASLANPDVADTVVLSPTQIYLTGNSSANSAATAPRSFNLHIGSISLIYLVCTPLDTTDRLNSESGFSKLFRYASIAVAFTLPS